MAKDEKTMAVHPFAQAGSFLKQNALFGLLSVVIFSLLAVFGSPVALNCDRVQRRGLVNCVRQTLLLGMIPLAEQRIDDVRGALVSETGDYEGDVGYRLELISAAGPVPLRSIYISSFSGKATKEELASQINRFVQSAAPGSLTLTEPGMMSLDSILCLMIGFLGSFIWEQISSKSGRARNA